MIRSRLITLIEGRTTFSGKNWLIWDSVIPPDRTDDDDDWPEDDTDDSAEEFYKGTALWHRKITELLKKKHLFVRVGEPPEGGRSKAFGGRFREAGVSAMPAYRFGKKILVFPPKGSASYHSSGNASMNTFRALISDEDPTDSATWTYLYSGKLIRSRNKTVYGKVDDEVLKAQVPTYSLGSDGEPVLADVKLLRRIKKGELDLRGYRKIMRGVTSPEDILAKPVSKRHPDLIQALRLRKKGSSKKVSVPEPESFAARQMLRKLNRRKRRKTNS